MPHQQPPHYISDEQALSRLCDQLESCTRLGIDTEFIGEDSFVPRLELIQLSTADFQVVLDFSLLQETRTLPRLWEIICSMKVEKVVHAGRQDLELLATHMGRLPRPFFDTQIAAAMLGYGAQIAYAQLVQRTPGARLEKSHTFTNWSQRPLSHDQIAYALARRDHAFAFRVRRGRSPGVRARFLHRIGGHAASQIRTFLICWRD